MKCPQCGLVTFDHLSKCPRCKQSFTLVRPLTRLGGTGHLLVDEPEYRDHLRDRLHRARLGRRKKYDNPLANGMDPEAPDWYQPRPAVESALAKHPSAEILAGGELKERASVEPVDTSTEDRPQSGATTIEEAAEDSFEDAAQLSFGGDAPGFADWRVELRERLKQIRARREREQADTVTLAAHAVPETSGVARAEATASFEDGTVGLAEPLAEIGEAVMEPVAEADATFELDLDAEAPEHPMDVGALASGEGVTTIEEIPGETLGKSKVFDEVIDTVRAEITAAEDGPVADEPGEPTAGPGKKDAAADLDVSPGAPERGWDDEALRALGGEHEPADAEAVEDTAAEIAQDYFDTLADLELSPGAEQPQELGPETETEESLESADELAASELDEDEPAIEEPEPAIEELEPAVGEPEPAAEELEPLLEAPVPSDDAAEQPLAVGAGEFDDEEVIGTEEFDDFELPVSPRPGRPATPAPPTAYTEAETTEQAVGELQPEFDLNVGEAVGAPSIDLPVNELTEAEADTGPQWDVDDPDEPTPRPYQSVGPLGERVAAALGDALFLLVIGAALLGAASSASGASMATLLNRSFWPLLAAWSIFAIGYSIFFVGTCGQTIGRMLMRLRVASTDRFDVGFGRAAARLVAYVISVAPAGIGLLPALRDPEHRTLYDRLTRTRVVKA